MILIISRTEKTKNIFYVISIIYIFCRVLHSRTVCRYACRWTKLLIWYCYMQAISMTIFFIVMVASQNRAVWPLRGGSMSNEVLFHFYGLIVQYIFWGDKWWLRWVLYFVLWQHSEFNRVMCTFFCCVIYRYGTKSSFKKSGQQARRTLTMMRMRMVINLGTLFSSSLSSSKSSHLTWYPSMCIFLGSRVSTVKRVSFNYFAKVSMQKLVTWRYIINQDLHIDKLCYKM